MVNLIRASVLACVLATVGGAADDKPIELKVGDAAPAFEARTDQDKTWVSAEHFGKKWVVVYSYPGDFTPGCTAQANAFKDGMNKLTELGVEVVGVSGDAVKSHELFKKAQKLNFTLLADPDGAVAKKFGVPFGKGATVKVKDADGKPLEIARAGTAARWTFVVGKDGKIAYKNTKVLPRDDAKAITEFIATARPCAGVGDKIPTRRSTRQDLTMPPPGPSPAIFFDTVNAFQRTEALKAAVELDLFTHLAGGHRTAADLAAACGADPRGVRILADYLTIHGFLTKEGDRYAPTPDADAFLNCDSPAYLGGALEFLLTPQLRECYQTLTAAVRRGGTAASAEGTVSHDNPVWVAFARAMAPMMRLPAELLAGLVGGDRGRPLKVLDVAAGHGLFGITIAKHYPAAHVTALDWANVLAVAVENAKAEGVADRLALLPGSAFEVDWGGPYDVVLLTNFLHHFDAPTCEQLAAKAHAALAPGGRALTLEFIPDDDRVNPPATAGFALTMLATTAGGDAYTFAEYERIFAAAGFARSEFHQLPPTTQQVVVSHKG